MYILNELLFFSPNDFINMTQNIWSNNIWIDTKSRKKGNISFGNRKLIDFSVLCLFLRMNTNALFYSVSMLLCLILLAALVRCSSFSKVIIIFLSPPFLQNIYKSKNQNKTKGRLLEYRRLMQLVLESMNYHVNCTLSWWSDPRSPPFPQSLFSPFFLFLFAYHCFYQQNIDSGRKSFTFVFWMRSPHWSIADAEIKVLLLSTQSFIRFFL